MANANPINSWDTLLLAESESAFGTIGIPTAAGALEVVSAKLGPSSEAGQVRPKRDRPLGRGMQNGFVEGDVEPFPFSVEYSQKSRAAIDTAAKDLAILKAAGMTQTINASTSTVLTVGNSPIETGAFASAQLVRYMGKGDALHQAEYLNGCVVKSINWSGGEKELTVKASGDGVTKTHIGRIDSASFASNIVTTLTVSASEIRRFGATLGAYVQCESEVMDLRPPTYSTTSFDNINRGLASTSAAAHTSKAIYPYMPTISAFTGSPLSEAVASAILGSISPMRIISWDVNWTTGMDLMPAETSSKYRQGAKSVRSNCEISMKMMMSVDRLDLLGYVRNRDTLSCTLSQGAGTGGIWTMVAPYCEVMQFEMPDTENDVCIVDLKLRVRENGAGNNTFTITLT